MDTYSFLTRSFLNFQLQITRRLPSPAEPRRRWWWWLSPPTRQPKQPQPEPAAATVAVSECPTAASILFAATAAAAASPAAVTAIETVDKWRCSSKSLDPTATLDVAHAGDGCDIKTKRSTVNDHHPTHLTASQLSRDHLQKISILLLPHCDTLSSVFACQNSSRCHVQLRRHL